MLAAQYPTDQWSGADWAGNSGTETSWDAAAMSTAHMAAQYAQWTDQYGMYHGPMPYPGMAPAGQEVWRQHADGTGQEAWRPHQELNAGLGGEHYGHDMDAQGWATAGYPNRQDAVGSLPSAGQGAEHAWPSRRPVAKVRPSPAPAPTPAPKPAPKMRSLPSPLRVPLGPDPAMPPAVFPALPEAADSLEASSLPPTGMILARAAGGSAEDAIDEPKRVSPSAPHRPSPPPGVPQSLGSVAENDAPAGISISQVEDGHATRVEWRIEDLRSRLQACMGRPLVSPPFATCDLPNLRLMVFPDAREAVKSARSRERKGMYAAMVRKGPLFGALRLKADCLDRSAALPVVRFHLTVGACRRGPFSYDFSEQAIHGCDDFGVDWLKQVEDSGCLRVAVEIFEVTQRGADTAANFH